MPYSRHPVPLGITEIERHQQNPPVVNWRCRLTQVDLYRPNGHQTVVVVGVDSTGSCKM